MKFELCIDGESLLLQVVKMLIVVVVVFAALWLPYRGMLVYNSFAMMFEKERFMDLWFLMFAKTCVFINRYAHIHTSKAFSPAV